MRLSHSLVATVVYTVASSCVIATPCCAEQTWGNLRGRFVWLGEFPASVSFEVPKQADAPAKTILDESLVVDRDNRGIANVAVILRPLDRDQPIPIHPSYTDETPKEVELSIDGNRYVPRAVVVRTGQTLVLRNNEAFSNNPNISLIGDRSFNPLLRPGETAEIGLSRAQRFPVPISANIHPWLRGWLIVSDHPYAAFTDANGAFEIQNMPTGEWTIEVWHERAGRIDSVVWGGRALTLDNGRMTVHIQPGTYDMGDVQISSEQFDHDEVSNTLER